MPNWIRQAARHPTPPVSILSACAFLAASLLIVAAARGDLWLDEIWSLRIARSVASPIEILRLHFDNNHPLYTLYLYLVQGSDTFSLHRLLAVLSGIGCVFLAALIARREWGDAEALCSVVLIGSSYPLLLYFSEARGYAPAMFFALLAHAALREALRAQRDDRMMLLYWAATALGFLAHLTFLFVFTANVLMHLVQAARSRGSRRPGSRLLLLYQVPPLLLATCWMVYFVHDLEVGGGPIYDRSQIAKEASALLLGLPHNEPWQTFALPLVLAASVAGLGVLLRSGSTAWPFFVGAVLLAPSMLFLVAQPTYLYFRYCIVVFPFFYLLLARLLCEAGRSLGGRWHGVVAVIILLVVAGQSARVWPLLEFGRGNYLSALTYLLRESPQPVVRLGSDHDFRNSMVIDFYARLADGGSRLRYVAQSRWKQEPPDWVFLHSQDTAYRPPMQFTAAPNLAYGYIDTYRFSGVSGWNWYLFRRLTPFREAEK